jgi:hypothetical protein
MFDLGRSPDVAAIPPIIAKPLVTVRPDEAAIQMPESPRPRSPPKPGFFTTIVARLRNGLTRHKNRGDRYRVHSEVTPPRSRTAKVSPATDHEFSALGKGLIMRKSKRRKTRIRKTRKTRKTRRTH